MRIETRSGFVEDEDWCILDDGTGNGNALTFATGKFDTAFTHKRAVSIREFGDEIMTTGFSRCFVYFFVSRITFSVANIFENGAVEEKSFLGDVGNGITKRILRYFGDILVVDTDGTFVDVVVTEKEFGDGGFSGARWTNECDFFLCSDREIEICECVLGIFECERYIVECDFSFSHSQRLCWLVVLNFVRGFKNFEDFTCITYLFTNDFDGTTDATDVPEDDVGITLDEGDVTDGHQTF